MKINEMAAFRDNSDVLSLDQEVTVLVASIQMADRNIGSVMVTEGKMIAGIVTERDFMVKVIAQKLDPASTRLVDIMTSDVQLATPEDDVEESRQRMEDGRFRHLPVVGEFGEVISMISQRDFINL